MNTVVLGNILGYCKSDHIIEIFLMLKVHVYLAVLQPFSYHQMPFRSNVSEDKKTPVGGAKAVGEAKPEETGHNPMPYHNINDTALRYILSYHN